MQIKQFDVAYDRLWTTLLIYITFYVHFFLFCGKRNFFHINLNNSFFLLHVIKYIHGGKCDIATVLIAS